MVQNTFGASVVLEENLLAEWGRSCPKALSALLILSAWAKYRDDRAVGKKVKKTEF